MRHGLLAIMGTAALALGACASTSTPPASCFSLVAGTPACEFEPLAGVEGVGR